MSEYSGPSNNAPCNYSALGSYNNGYSMAVPVQGKQVQGTYIVPTWAPISYDSLSSGGTCSGYNSIGAAYGQDAGNCQTTYRTSLCGGRMN